MFSANDYSQALASSFLFYEAQRSGVLPATNRIPWRRNSALGDAVARYDANNNGQLETNETLSRDLAGGYYDAGDRMKYTYPLASSLTLLSWGATQYQGGYQATGQLDEALDAIKWGVDWLLKSHETTGAGTSLQTVRLWGQVGRTSTDHNNVSDDQNIALPRPAYFIDATKPGSDLAAEVAAAFASASILFRSSDSAYADQLLDHAKALYKFAYQYQGRYSNVITDTAYPSNNYNDDLAWGAVWLHKAIKAINGNVNQTFSWAGNQTYLQIAKSKNPGLGNWTQTWGDKEYGTAVLMAMEDPSYDKTDLENWLNYWTVSGPGHISYSPGGLAFLAQWGSLRLAANTAFLAAVYSDTVRDYNGRYAGFAQSQIDYILGDNPRNSSYLVGFGSNYSRNPHHAHAHLNNNPAYNGSNGWTVFNSNTPNYNLLVGALVGGPASANDFDYQDNRLDYIRNEPALDSNAAFSGVLAYLYQNSDPLIIPNSITLTVSPASVAEDGTSNLVYTFTRTGVTTNALTVKYTVGGTATFSTDYTQSGAASYTATTGTVTFAANATTATVTVDPTVDTTVESNETVVLTLASGTGYTLGATTTATGTINNDDTSVTLAVAPGSVTEDGTTNLIYTFTRSGVTSNALTVNYNVGGTATFSTDYTQSGAASYTATTGTVTFAANATTATVTVDPTADTTIEPNETVIFTLAAGTGYTLGTTTAVTGTINNDDTSVTLAVAPGSVTEDGTTNLIYTFTRSGVTSNALTVNYNVGGTANFSTDYTQSGAASYTATAGTVTFAANANTATVTVDPTADTIIEPNETVIFTLAAGTGYTLGTTTAVTGTINNDDFSQLSINDINVVEGKDSNAILTVTVNNPNPQPISVNYATGPIDAIANVDYTSKTGTLIIPANTSTATITIPLLNDNLNEPDEIFTVTLSNPVNAIINPDEAIGQVIISDTLQSAITRTLPNNVENLKLIGTNNINGTGNAGNNKITGNSGNNILAGRDGDDTYCFNASTPLGSDTIQETTTGGIDTLDFTGTNTPVRVNLGTTAVQTAVTNNLKLTFSANNTIENIIGDTGNDRLTGNALNNTLTGGAGSDQLTGQDGNDNLIGGSGDDLLTGGNGSDNFIFNSNNLGIDAIADFSPDSDKIVLSKATFTALQSIIGNGFSQPAEFASVADDDLVATSSAFIVYSTSSGSIYYNQNGSTTGLGSGAEFAYFLTIPTLTESDFLLIT